MSNPILRKAPPLFLGVIPSKIYDSWVGDPIFLGWGSDLFGLGPDLFGLGPDLFGLGTRSRSLTPNGQNVEVHKIIK